MKLSEVKIGKTFKVGNLEFVKFVEDENSCFVVARESVFNSTYGSNNNFANSKILERLNREILPKIENEIGTENMLKFETDLTALDGLKTYGSIKSKISLPTIDFYRQNVEIFDEHKIDAWWWLATPDTTPDHYNDRWTVCVAPSGSIFNGNFYGYGLDFGVRPILCFVSSISVSCEE